MDGKIVIGAVIIIALIAAFAVPVKQSYTLDIITNVRIVNGQPWIMGATYIVVPSKSPLISFPSIGPANLNTPIYKGNTDPVLQVTVSTAGQTYTYKYIEDVETYNAGQGPVSNPIFVVTRVTNINPGIYNITILFSYDYMNTTLKIPAYADNQIAPSAPPVSTTPSSSSTSSSTTSTSSASTSSTTSSSSSSSSSSTNYNAIIQDLETLKPTFVTSVPNYINPNVWYVVSTNGQWSGATGTIIWSNEYPLPVQISLTPIWQIYGAMTSQIYFYTSNALYSGQLKGFPFTLDQLGSEQYIPLGLWLANHPIYWADFGVNELEPVSGLPPFDSQYTGSFIPASASTSSGGLNQMPTSVPFSITVMSSSTGAPLSGATVSVQGVGTFTTNSNGVVQFSLAPNVQYSVTVSANDYQSWSGTIEYKLSSSWSSQLINNLVYLAPSGSSSSSYAL